MNLKAALTCQEPVTAWGILNIPQVYMTNRCLMNVIIRHPECTGQRDITDIPKVLDNIKILFLHRAKELHLSTLIRLLPNALTRDLLWEPTA